jgi:outer membrane protein assembly factor BamA
MAHGKKWNEKGKEMFKTPYSQFVKIETDLTKTWTIDQQSQLVGHINAGHMWVFGNSDEAPFSEKFYVGGANSIRAFNVRTIGPGAYHAAGNRQTSYLMQNGHTKLVLNLEYRRKLFGNLYGALFLDAGNVWTNQDFSLSKTSEMTTSEKEWVDQWNEGTSNLSFKPSTFFEQLATGTGLGLRYDLEFLVVRIDWGFGLHLPYRTEKSGYFNIPRFQDMHTLHLAIGYPF